jgi:uncharacterized Tic20 family protein
MTESLDHTESVDRDERRWAMLCHLSTLVGYCVPFGNVLAPLAIWHFKREGAPLVDDQGREALNFQLSMTLYLVVAGILCLALIGIPLVLGLLLFDLIVVIIAAVEADTGQPYRYPLTIRFIK